MSSSERSTWLSAALSTVGPGGFVRSLTRLTSPSGAYPVHIFSARLSEEVEAFFAESGTRSSASGCALDSRSALAAAMAEAAERYAFSGLGWTPREETEGPGVSKALPYPVEELPLLLSPTAPTISDLRCALDQAHDWLAFAEWLPESGSAHRLHLPAASVFASHSTPSIPASSNGLGAGYSVSTALRSAVLELIERDAFMIRWLHQLPGRVIDATSLLPRRITAAVDRLAEQNVSFRLYDISSELPVSALLGCTIMRQKGRGVAAVFGAAAGLERAEAAQRAFRESAMAWYGYLEARDTGEQVSELSAPRDFTDHARWYATPERFSQLEGFLRGAEALQPSEEAQQHRLAPPRDLDELVKALAMAGLRVYYRDITPRPVEDLGLRVVRAVVPGLVPLSWGEYQPMPCSRLTSPRFALGARPFAELSTQPHPFP